MRICIGGFQSNLWNSGRARSQTRDTDAAPDSNSRPSVLKPGTSQPRKPRLKWIALSPELLAGNGLEPYPPAEIGGLFDWAENPGAGSTHAMPHAGDFLADIVRIEANAVHQPNKPDDEVVVVLHGVLELTDDGTGIVQAFGEGEVVLIPRGWAGLYRCVPAADDFLELAIVPHDYFAPRDPDPTGASPRRIVMPAAGTQAFHRGRFMVEAQGSGAAWSDRFDQAGDEVLLVKQGALTLTAGGARETFGPGAVVIIPRGLEGHGETSDDYRALAITWLG